MAGTTSTAEGPETTPPDAKPKTGERTARQAMELVADGKIGGTDEEKLALENDALAWFLDDEDPVIERGYTVNVGTDDNPQQIVVRMRALEADEITRIESGDLSGRRRGRNVEPDSNEVNARIVAASMVVPDLAAVAKQKGIADSMGDPLWARVQVLKWRFRKQPGLIARLSVNVMSLSGFDDADVKAIESGKG
jgi:hypothetical protein